MAAASELFFAATNATAAIATPQCPAFGFVNVSTSLIPTIQSLTTLTPALSQDQTNGPNSFLGTLNAPALPPYLNATTNSTVPWGNATANNTNPEIPPDTGVTRFYDFTISRGVLSPDGVNRSMLLINGQFPGPMIEANWGDTINVTVTNAIESAVEDGVPYDTEGSALHWHGLLQKDTPYYDGVPSVQQCPIAPQKSFTYSFRADLYGTSWYHSHYSAQYAGGAFGPMIVYGPSSATYDIDLGPVMLSDWNHDDYYKLVQQDSFPNQTAVAGNNTLINGKMNYNCTLLTDPKYPRGSDHTCTENAGLSKFQFTPGKTHRLRLINSGAEGQITFTIDSHLLTVIATDFVPIVPWQNETVTLGIGQRMDVLVTANQDADAYWMRAIIPSFQSTSGCSLNFQPNALAAVYYEGADTNSVPQTTSTFHIPFPAECVDSQELFQFTPAYKKTPPSAPAVTQHIQVNNTHNDTCNPLFTMNNVSFVANYNDPILPKAQQGNFDFPENTNLYNFGTNSSVRLYVQNLSPIAHPMHLHGHNFWVLAQGLEPWDGTIQAADPTNPPRRDVQIMPKALKNSVTNQTQPGYLVLEYETDNPGVWPFHCHIAWHVSGGLYINTVEQPASLNETQIPDVLAQTCTDWDTFTASHAPDQIDSGLRIIRA